MSGKRTGALRAGLGLALVALLAASAPADAATAWTAPFPLSSNTYGAVMGSDGTTVYPEILTVSGHAYPAVQVRPPGGPLGTVQQLAATTTGNVPTVAAGPDGRFVAAWVEAGNVQTMVMPAGATTFGDLVSMPSAGDSPSGPLAVAIDAAGNASLLWSTSVLNSSSQQTVFLRAGVRPATGSASSQVIDTVGPTASMIYSYSGLQLAVSESGAAIAGWQRQDMNTSTSSTTGANRIALRPAGGVYQTPVTLDSYTNMSGFPTTTFLGWPQVAMNATGAAAAAWRRSDSMGANALKLSFGDASGLGSSPENPVVSGGINPGDPLLALTGDGRAIVAWLATVNTVQRPQVGVRAAGGGFAPAQTVQTTGDQASQIDLAVGRSGTAILGFTTLGSGTCGFMAAVAPPGGTFGAPTGLGLPFANSCLPPSAAVGPSGDGVMAWEGVRSNATYTSEAAGFDASGPTLTGLVVPPTGTAGTPLALSVNAIDIWNALTTAWDFGDGTTATGGAVSHTFAAPGNRTVTVTATDAIGNATSATGPVSVAAPSGGSTPPDTVAPVIGGLSLTHKTFAVAKAATALAAASTVARGTVLRYTVSEAATVTVAIQRRRPGLRNGKRCVAPTAKLRRQILRTKGKRGLAKAACTRWPAVGTLTRHPAAGPNRLPFSGRIGTKALVPGTYRAVLHAKDAARNVSKAARIGFHVVRPR
jgi:hypothetical protein